MNILLIAQCSQRALTESRRILDQFAERKGDRTWQTAITQEGLNTLRKLLRKTARRNTAVACHWIRSANHTELLWIIGNQSRFNVQGSVPVHYTTKNILRGQDEDTWHSAHVMAVLAGIAGLFHDIGKANGLFQQKLAGSGKIYEPYRHEWVSLRLFQSFIISCADAGSCTDEAWLSRLAAVNRQDESRILGSLIRDDAHPEQSPFVNLPPLAKTVAWLIVTHHRLPAYPGGHNPPDLSRLSGWLDQLCADWNATNASAAWSEEERAANWSFTDGTPLVSQSWQQKAKDLVKRISKLTCLQDHCWLEQRFTLHLARLSLMLADHCYSAAPPQTQWQDPACTVWANTDRKTGRPKQKLDEHCVGVAHHAYLLARSLPTLRRNLPAITRHKVFTQRHRDARFRWQDKACDLARAVQTSTRQHGFFGVNMASTGCGKTFANARIMYGLSDEQQGCRFSVALGLRTLTLQTGDALRERLHLDEDDLAVLVGSAVAQQLHEQRKQMPSDINDTLCALMQAGSESAEDFAEHFYVKYEGSLYDGYFNRWLDNPSRSRAGAQAGQPSKLRQLISAPILVSTIDHLMPATEGARGGQQIAPMLRLLCSDLVLDEPDDFGLEDLPALCRLVNWAGVLGARVLLSSATLPPALTAALFDAYRQGRRDYQQVNGEPSAADSVICAWFDEYRATSETVTSRQDFTQSHNQWVDRRLRQLKANHLPLRKARCVPLAGSALDERQAIQATADVMHRQIVTLHDQHHEQHSASGKKISIGMIRMANIEPLVATAVNLLERSPPPHYRFHYCIYHSQHPLAMRSHIEKHLDLALMRDLKDPAALYRQPEIRQAIEQHPEEQQVFIVLATPVVEVGRDHDYDWAIVEPSSMRSLIQLAGRVQRHRQRPPDSANIAILGQNIKSLQGKKHAYCHPGFEIKPFTLSSHQLQDILTEDSYHIIDATPRLQQPSNQHLGNMLQSEQADNLVVLEHATLIRRLFMGSDGINPETAELWWPDTCKQKNPSAFSSLATGADNPTLFGEIQRRQPFRQSRPQIPYYLVMEEDEGAPVFTRRNAEGAFIAVDNFRPRTIDNIAAGNQAWLTMGYAAVYDELAQHLDVREAHGECVLDEKPSTWQYDPLLGVFQGTYLDGE